MCVVAVTHAQSVTCRISSASTFLIRVGRKWGGELIAAAFQWCSIPICTFIIKQQLSSHAHIINWVAGYISSGNIVIIEHAIFGIMCNAIGIMCECDEYRVDTVISSHKTRERITSR